MVKRWKLFIREFDFFIEHIPGKDNVAADGFWYCCHLKKNNSIGPILADEDGIKYVLTVICCFTRWVSLYPLKDLTAKGCAECLLQHVGTFGTLHRRVTDYGTQLKKMSWWKNYSNYWESKTLRS